MKIEAESLDFPLRSERILNKNQWVFIWNDYIVI